jgi:hypothetical protein
MGWHEVTLEQWRMIESAKSFSAILSILTGLTENQVKRFGGKFYIEMTPFLNWLDSKPSPAQWALSSKIMLAGKELPTNIDITKKTFGQKIIVHQLMASQAGKQNMNAVISDTVAVYLQPLLDGKFSYERAMALKPEVEKMKLCHAFPLGGYFFDQMHKVVEREVNELTTQATGEQMRAGIDMFDQFGVNNTIDALAGGDILKYDEVLMMDYNTVFLKLKRMKLENKFNKNYQQIMQAKK